MIYPHITILQSKINLKFLGTFSIIFVILIAKGKISLQKIS